MVHEFLTKLCRITIPKVIRILSSKNKVSWRTLESRLIFLTKLNTYLGILNSSSLLSTEQFEH